MLSENLGKTTLKESLIKNSQEHYEIYEQPTPLDKMVKSFREFTIDLVIQEVGMELSYREISEELGSLLFNYLIDINTKIAGNMIEGLSANSTESIPELQAKLKEHAKGMEMKSFVTNTRTIIRSQPF